MEINRIHPLLRRIGFIEQDLNLLQPLLYGTNRTRVKGTDGTSPEEIVGCVE